MSVVPPPHRSVPPEVVLWRFSVRRMLVYIAVLSGLFAVLSRAGATVSVAVTGVVLVLGAHFLASVVGTRLRDGATARQKYERETGIDVADPKLAVGLQRIPVRELDLPADHHLSGRNLPTRRQLAIVLGGAALGFVGGAIGLSAIVGDRVTWPGLAVGSVSTCVLTTWVAFLVTSFCGVSRAAWKQASLHEKKPSVHS